MADDDTKPEETPKPAEESKDAPKAPKTEAKADAKAEIPAKADASADAAAAKPAEGEAAKPAEGDAAKPAEGEAAKDAKDAKDGKPKDIFAELDPDGAAAPKVLKAKGSKNVQRGIVHVRATFNNTMVTITDPQGNTIGWATSGKMGFRGSRKSTAYAAQVVTSDACRQAMSHGLKEAEVRVKGPGTGREAAVRAVQNIGIAVTKISDVTPIPHNGCRPKKARRV